MWGLFFASVAVVVASLFLPGYLVLRGLGVMRAYAFSCAPLIGVAAYVLLGVLYAELGIWSCWVTQAVPLMLLGFALFIVLRRKLAGKLQRQFGLSDYGMIRNALSYDSACLLGYIVFGVVFAGILFVWYLGSPDAYAQEYDNIHHLGVIRSFVDSGVWSPFNSSLYSSSIDASINPLPGGGFYPTAWYSFAALAMTSTGASSAMAENVANFVFVAVVLPAGVFALVRVAFDRFKSVLPFGSVCALLFSGFPWMLVYFGPLYPNLSAFCLVPAAASVFLLFFQCGCSKRQRIGLACLFVVSLVSLAFAQTNAVFTLAVLLAPFCVWKASRIPLQWRKEGYLGTAARMGFGVVAVGAIVAIWLLLYKAPFLQGVVQHTWPPCSTAEEAFLDVLLLGLKSEGSQIVLAILVVAGLICTLIERRYLWLSFSYVLVCVIYCINACSGGVLKHVFAGFWYTDPWRCGAMVALVGIFLATLGLWAVWRVVMVCLSALGRRCSFWASSASALAVSLALILGAVFPGIPAPGSQSGAVAFRSVLSELRQNIASFSVYDDEEKSFVQKVMQIVPEGSLVINVPDDGSAFAFAADGLRTYFRYTREYDVLGETSESVVIRNGLCDLEGDEAVREAVSSIGAQYVLQLDQGQPGVSRDYLFTYGNGEQWQGIDAIRDDTPGFEVVLAEGDMRLYRIVVDEI